MTNNVRPLFNTLRTSAKYFTTLLSAAFLFSCATVSKAKVMDRSATPEVRSDVGANTSEIREIDFHGQGSEQGHKDLHLMGQLFTKTQVSGTTQIKPCVGCRVTLGSSVDTASKANIITASDGFFEFDGKLPLNTITITAPNYNTLEITNVNFNSGGVTTMKVIVASGSRTERFTLNKNAKQISWSKME